MKSITAMAIALLLVADVAAAGQASGRWPAEKASGWYAAQPWLIGCNFLPSTAVNDVEMWQAESFDAATIERELGWARDLGFNSVRVFLNFVVWEADPAGLKHRFERFLAIVDKVGIRAMPVLFDDCNFAGRIATTGRQPDPVPGVHNSQWVSSPPGTMVVDKAAWPRLERYVRDLVGTFANDRRVVVWDLYNEPGNSGMGTKSQPLMEAAFGWAREVKPAQPLTVGAWAQFEAPFSRRMMELSDVISFHGYDARAGIEAKLKLCGSFGRPVLCTEWLRRQAGNTFETLLPLFRDRRIACYNWGLVAGRTQTYFPWGSPKGSPEPKQWQHDIFRRDGAPFADLEVDVIRFFTGARSKSAIPDWALLMPRAEDYTLLWWMDGFPAHTPGAPWERCIQTGHYAMVLDTRTLRILHFGAVPRGTSYQAAARADNRVCQALPPAELAMSLAVGGKRYRCTAGGAWTQFAGPRLVESGRFLQRADLTDLVFTADDGAKLNVDARLEAAAWPDRLGLILAARPGLLPMPPGEQWRDAVMEISLAAPNGTVRGRWQLPTGRTWGAGDWQEAFVALNPASFQAEADKSPVSVRAAQLPGLRALPVDYDTARGWRRVNLDNIEPIAPPGGRERQNDAVERVKLMLENPTGREQIARLLLAKNGSGIRHRIGAPITGMSAMIRDETGQPTGIPVQLSKNWHARPQGGVYAGTWFHGLTQVRLPAKAKVELELTLAYGHWGGVAAASHAQLCLIGWGSNQLWDQSALGSWGESICYEPDQVQGQCAILDVRPVMVRSMAAGQPWFWTHNVGGGDFFRLFDHAGQRLSHARMRTAYERHGPCLSEVTYAGRIGEGVEHAATVSLARTDDIVRGVYRLRLDVEKPTDFSRFVIFQIGADTYSYTGERKMAWGNETGLVREWATQWGGDTYRTEPMECTGRMPWISLHDAVAHRRRDEQGAWANRGVVIRSWKAQLGGKPAGLWIAERGVKARGRDTSTLDVVPPPGIRRLKHGDFVEAIFEHLVVPQSAEDYYGPNEALRTALRENANTWRMIYREAAGNDRHATVKTGELMGVYPAIIIRTVGDAAELTLTGGLAYVPISFTGLSSPRGHRLMFDGQPVNQAIHGNDYWQTDYDARARCWTRTYNLPIGDDKPHSIRFERKS